MATATSSMLEQMVQEVTTLENELAGLNAKLANERRILGDLTDARTNLSESIALGKETQAKASELAAKIQGSEAAITGFEGLIRRKQARLDEVIPVMRQMRAEAERASDIAEVESLKAEGAAIIARIAEVLNTTANGDLQKCQEVRQRLSQFADRGRMGTFPIPPIALAASDAARALDQTIAETLAPVLKLWR